MHPGEDAKRAVKAVRTSSPGCWRAFTIGRRHYDIGNDLFARQRCRGLPVRIELMDYRDLTETFDRIVSVGMFEHVGVR
jgi:cyclopropane fatty-acyl-phospholipid synthase-like methyltransferase